MSNNHDDVLRRLLRKKILTDYDRYVRQELMESKEHIYLSSVYNAIAIQWKDFFDNCFEGKFDHTEIVVALLEYDNIFALLMGYSNGWIAEHDNSITLSRVAFGKMFEQYAHTR